MRCAAGDQTQRVRTLMVPRSKAGNAGACRDCRIMTSDHSPADATRMRSPSASGGMPHSPAPATCKPLYLQTPALQQ